MTPRKLLYFMGLLALLLMLAACAPAAPAGAPAESAQPAAADLPAEPGRGTDGALSLVYWQEVSILNPYLSTGTKDTHGASLILEPLLRVAPDGSLVPTLAAEVPTLENGGFSEDLTTLTYKLNPDIVWSDGTPFTADDVVFTWQYCTNPETGCGEVDKFSGVTSVEAIDANTVQIIFSAPQPYPYTVFAAAQTPILQKAQFEACVGAAAQACGEQNTNPVGTGPYKVKEFRANDTVVYEINENFRDPAKPHFAEVTFKGAEDASAAARAVLETGEADYAWNLQVEPAILSDMEARGIGTIVSAYGGNVERILFNHTNPDPALGDMRSVWSADDPNPHPFFSDPAVRQAMSMAIDRNIIAEQLYGASGKATCNVLSGPPNLVSTANDGCLVQDIAGANQLLDDAGYVDSDGDGIRETPDGTPLNVLFQTSTNSVRQSTQALVQQWWKEIGIETELKNVEAAVYFGSDPASPDTISKFFADLEMYTSVMDNPDAEAYMNDFLCMTNDVSNIPNPANSWGGSNNERWCNPEYDAKFAEFKAAVGAEREQLAKELNDMIAQDYANMPLVYRASVSAHINTLAGVEINSWDSEEWNIQDWHRAR